MAAALQAIEAVAGKYEAAGKRLQLRHHRPELDPARSLLPVEDEEGEDEKTQEA